MMSTSPVSSTRRNSRRSLPRWTRNIPPSRALEVHPGLVLKAEVQQVVVELVRTHGETDVHEGGKEHSAEYYDKLAELQKKQWRSKAVNDTYEPGSTFKVLTLQADWAVMSWRGVTLKVCPKELVAR